MKLTGSELSEQAGAFVADRMLDLMKAAPSQAQRLHILQYGLREIVESPGALPGFSVVLIAWLDRALGLH